MTEAKERIIEIAYHLFFKYGISSVTMDYIAKECGMSKRTVYEYFADKNSLISSIIFYGHQKEAQKFKEIMNADSNALTILLCIYERNREFFENVNKTFFTDLKRLYPKIASEFVNIRKSHLEDLSKVLALGQSQTLIRNDIESKILATLFFNLMNAISNMEDIITTELTIANIHAIGIDCLLRGILTERGTKLYMEYRNKNQL